MSNKYYVIPNPAGNHYSPSLKEAIERAELLSIQNPTTIYKIALSVGEVVTPHAAPVTTIFDTEAVAGNSEKFAKEAKGRFYDDGEPRVKLPELPEGYEWEYRGLGWDSNGREVEIVTLGTWQNEEVVSNKVITCIAAGYTDVHYWEKVEVKPTWRIGEEVEVLTISGWKQGEIIKIHSDGLFDVHIAYWDHPLSMVTPDKIRKVTL